MIADALAGKRIFITGPPASWAPRCVERLLRSVPDCELVLLVRPGGASTVEQRVAARDLQERRLRPAARRARARTASTRWSPAGCTVVAGDVEHRRARPRRRRPGAAGRAATSSSTRRPRSSFDSPLDSAVEVNLLGPTRIAADPAASSASPPTWSRCRPATSPATAAARRPRSRSTDEPVLRRRRLAQPRSTAPAGPAADAEAESRTPEQLERVPRRRPPRARRRRRPAAGRRRPSSCRSRWVERPHGRGRRRPGRLARLARRLRLHQGPRRAGAARDPRRRAVSIVRPSIIESALAEPRPGWIRGFRMAEPVIISYARGLLKEFPGVPEGIVDVIPVDLVVAAIIAVAAEGPDVPTPTVRPTSCRSRRARANPLRYRRLVDLVQRLVQRAPALRHRRPADRRARVVVPRPRPGAGPARAGQDRRSSGPRRSLQRRCPLRGKQAEWSATVEEQREEAERALGYVELYGAYAECEAVYGVDRLLALWDALDRRGPGRRSASIPASIDWDALRHRHPPAVGRRARPGAHHAGRPHRRARDDAAARARCCRPTATSRRSTSRTRSSPRTSSRRTRGSPPAACRRDERLRFVAADAGRGARRCWPSTARTAATSCRYFYRRYDGRAGRADRARTRPRCSAQLILAKSFPAAIRRVREHRALGHRTVLITGALDFVVEPLRPLFDDIVCATMSTSGRDGAATPASCVDVPPTGESRAQALIDYAAAHGLDLARVGRLRRLDQRPADARGGRLPGGGQPRDPPGRPGPQARLAGRAVDQVRRRARACWCRSAPAPHVTAAWPTRSRGTRPMKALRFERNVPRYAAAIAAGRVRARRRRQVGPLRLARHRPARAPRSGLGRSIRPRLAGICGSDLATIDGTSSRYFEPIVSFPFVPGHEVVADLDAPTARAGSCSSRCSAASRAASPALRRLRARRPRQLRAHRLRRTSSPGLQTGFCCDTGGGWSTLMVAHASQLHAVPDGDDRRGRGHGRADRVRGARRAGRRRRPGDDRRRCSAPARSACSPSPPLAPLHRRPAPSSPWPSTPCSASWPATLGADLGRRARPSSRGPCAAPPASLALGDGDIVRLTGGADVVIDCVGSEASLAAGLAVVRPRRPTCTMVGMPGHVHVDLTGLWQREIALARRLRLRHRDVVDGERRAAPSTWPSSWSRRPTSAGWSAPPIPSPATPTPSRTPPHAGARGAVKIAFDLRDEKESARAVPTRPGFVLDVDRSTPPVLFHHGEQFRLEKLPAGPVARHLPGRAARAARRHRRRHPPTRCSTRIGDTDPLPALLRPGMKLTIAFDDISLPLPPMKRPDIRQRVIEAVLDLAAAAGVDDVAPHRRARAAPPHDRGRAAPRRRRPGLRRVRAARPALQPRRRGPRQPRLPRHHRQGRGGRDQQAGRRERPARLRQHQPRVDGRRLEEHGHRPVQLPQPAPPPQRPDHAAQPSRSWTGHASELHSSNWRMGKVLRKDSGVKVFQIETTINNNVFGTDGPDDACCRSASGSGTPRDRVSFMAMKAGLDRMPARRRRSIFQAWQAPHADDVGAGR